MQNQRIGGRIPLFLLFLQEIISKRHPVRRRNAGLSAVCSYEKQPAWPLFFAIAVREMVKAGLPGCSLYVKPGMMIRMPIIVSRITIYCQYNK